MLHWRDILNKLGENAEDAFAQLARKLAERFRDQPLAIAAYRGYGDERRIVLRGRVLQASGKRADADHDSTWANLVDTYRRFSSHEVAGAIVQARFNGDEQEVITGAEGYFELRMPIQAPAPSVAWHRVELHAVAPDAPNDGQAHALGEVFVPQPAAQFGVISDIDDTVVRTDATNLLRMARTVFLGNARTRLPFPGVAALYRALHAGAPGPFVNPIFYVSSSPWNIYDMLVDFFALRGLPNGAMFLRDWGIRVGHLPLSHRAHKLAAIRELLDFYPTLPFLLIGDSGQQDPEIYAEAVRLYPNRIRAVYIRSVDHDEDRIAAIKMLTEEAVLANCTLILADDTLAMAQHAAAQGWITQAALDEVAADKAQDTGAKDEIEMLLDEDEPQVVDTPAPQQAAAQVEQIIEQGEREGESPTIVVEDKELRDESRI